MEHGDDRRHPAAQIEAHRDVEQDADQAREHRVDRLQLEVASHLRPDELHPSDLELPELRVAGERGLHPSRHLLGGHARERQPDDELARVAELLDHRLAELDPGEARADLGHRRRALEAHLHERPAGEVDVVPETAPGHERAETEQREGDGDVVGPLPLADEVVVRVLEELDHRLRSRSPRPCGGPRTPGRRGGA